MRIGILGGTFDPVHLGHLHIAKAALGEYELSELWFMPAGEPYFKENEPVTAASLRFKMTEYTLSGLSEPFKASDFELKKKGRTYTAETLSELRRIYPQYELYFIMGLDSLRALKTWYRPDKILSDSVILCAGRESEDSIDKEISLCAAKLDLLYPGALSRIKAIHTYELPISSTLIREKIRMGEDVSDLLHPLTYRFIKEHGLYSS